MHNVHHEINEKNARRAFDCIPCIADHFEMNNLQRFITESRFGTQRNLAEFLNVDQATIQRACVEHKSAKLSTYKACATALGVTIHDIFAEADRSMAEQQLLEAYRCLPKERREGWNDIVRGVLSRRREDAEQEDQTPLPTSSSPLT